MKMYYFFIYFSTLFFIALVPMPAFLIYIYYTGGWKWFLIIMADLIFSTLIQLIIFPIYHDFLRHSKD